MEPARWQQVKQVLEGLASLPPDDRAAELAVLRSSDPALCEDVEAYLAHEPSSGFLEPLVLATPVVEGTRFGPYTVQAALDSGGMGDVYRAVDARLDRVVAIKVLPEHLVTGSTARKRFDREARLASALNHPNVVTIHDVGRQDGRAYLVMEHVEGRTLKQVLAAGPLPIRMALEYATQAARGLTKAHAAGIVHRDIKPSNLMVTPDGLVKILDFGLATLRHAASEPEDVTTTSTAVTSQVGRVAGTPPYMSPEQAQGQPLDHRTDLWSLGVVLYEMVAGRRPFQGASTADLLYRIASVPAEPVTSHRPDVPAGVARIIHRALVKDLGARYATAEAMLADLEAPQLGPSRPLDQDEAPLSIATLPARLSSFIGRHSERTAVAEALGEARLLTLTGPGGTGKTSLALEAVRGLGRRFPDGVYFVPLASIREAELLAPTIADALGLRTTTTTSSLDQLLAYVGTKRVLLVLDNFEQLLDAGPVVSALLEHCPELKILVTSRASLKLRAEHELRVPPLTLPDPGCTPTVDKFMESEAVSLFVHRTRMHDPTFELTEDNGEAVVEICARLDGLPLAIELAAARTRLLPPGAMLARFTKGLDLPAAGGRDRPERHQTLRTAIQWSYDLLQDRERCLLRRLSVCHGGCTLETAEAIAAALGSEPEEVYEGVAALLDCSLLHREEPSDGEPRVRMLETIRAFGLEQLATSGEGEQCRAAHAEHFLALGEQAAPRLTGSRQRLWLERLDRDQDNLRAALDWLQASPERVGRGLRLASALWRYWLDRAHVQEGRERLQRLVALSDTSEDLEASARALGAAGSLTEMLGAFADAERLRAQSLALWRQLGDREQIAAALVSLGWVYWWTGDYRQTKDLTQQGLELHRQCGNDVGVTTAMNSLGWTALARGEYTEARTLLQQVVDRRRADGDMARMAFALANLGLAEHRQGEVERGWARVQEALAVSRDVGAQQSLMQAVFDLADCARNTGDVDVTSRLLEEIEPWLQRFGRYAIGRIARVQAHLLRLEGDLPGARVRYEQSAGVAREFNDRWFAADGLVQLGRLARELGDQPDQVAPLYRESLELNQYMENQQGIVDCLEGLAGLSVAQHDAAGGARLFGAADGIRQRIGAPVVWWEKPRYDRDRTSARSACGDPAAFESCLTAGRNMPLSDVIALALANDEHGPDSKR